MNTGRIRAGSVKMPLPTSSRLIPPRNSGKILVRPSPLQSVKRRTSEVFGNYREKFCLSALAVCKTPQPVDDMSKKHEIRIRIYSNYGNENTISCSTIDVLNKDRIPIPIRESKINTDNGNNKSPLGKLFDRQLIKKESTSLWTHPWPPPMGVDYLEITLIVFDDDCDSIRIWPNSMIVDANIKQIEVYLDGKHANTAEIPNDFGLNIPMTHEEDDDQEIKRIIIQNPTAMRPFDTKGFIPLQSTMSIEFCVVEGYLENSSLVGLRLIRLYDINGDVIPVRKKATVELHSFETKSGVMNLFEETAKFTINEQFQGEFYKNNSIKVVFPLPILLAAVEIVNHVSQYKKSDIGVKKLKIKINEVVVWVGKLEENLATEGKNDNKKKLIFFVDDAKVINHIKTTPDFAVY